MTNNVKIHIISDRGIKNTAINDIEVMILAVTFFHSAIRMIRQIMCNGGMTYRAGNLLRATCQALNSLVGWEIIGVDRTIRWVLEETRRGTRRVP